MFFNFPPLVTGKKGEEVTCRLFSTRESDDGTTNVDFLHFTTEEDGKTLTTHFGIQGRSDHLAKLCGNDDTGEAIEGNEATA